jgi:hypothetical protein
MVIKKYHIGAHGKKTVYAVCADQTETGDKLHEICRFETLETATAVLKYMRGDSMSEADIETAKEAIKKADTVPAKAQATA